jgi:hypothetical protein
MTFHSTDMFVVDAINRDFVLGKLKDKEYQTTIREKVLDAIKNKSIDDFAKHIRLKFRIASPLAPSILAIALAAGDSLFLPARYCPKYAFR